MVLFGDYHTHTKYSDGHGTIIDSAKIAELKGLKEIAITDHGFNHGLHGLSRRKLDKYIEECKQAERDTGIRIYHGIEANFISADGSLDLNPVEEDRMDIVVAGYHKSTHAKTVRDQLSFIAPNICSFRPSAERIDKNTTAIMRALEKNRIDILAHLNQDMKVDTMKVALAARDTGTYVELNAKHMLFSEEEVAAMAQQKVRFIIDSDAHEAENIGENNKAFYLVTTLNIPLELVANIDKFPIFKKGR